MNKFIILILCSLYSHSLLASCLDKKIIENELKEFDQILSSMGNEAKLVEEDRSVELKDLLIRVLNQLNQECSKARSNELFEFVMDAFEKLESEIPEKSQYDAVIVGGGITGTATAIAIEEFHNVLVIEKNSWPSIFGHAGSFYLNTKFDHQFKLQNSPFFLRQFSYLPLFLEQYYEAQSLGRNLLLNLFISNAQVLLNTEVDRIQPLSKTTFEVKTKNGKLYSSDHVIVSTGQGGVKTERFKNPILLDEELAKPNGNVESVESFYIKVRQNPDYLKLLREKDVAIIGGRDGGIAALLAILGMFPGSEDADKIPDHSKIHWIGGRLTGIDKAYAILKNCTDHFIQYPDKKAIELNVTDAGMMITLDDQVQLNVSHVLLATGYNKYLDHMIPNLSDFVDQGQTLSIIGAAKFYNLRPKTIGFYAHMYDQAGAAQGYEINTFLKKKSEDFLKKSQNRNPNHRWIQKLLFFKQIKELESSELEPSSIAK